MINNYEAPSRSTEFFSRTARIAIIGMGIYGIDLVAQMQFDRPHVEFWAIDTNPETIARIPISKSILLEDRSTWNEEISTVLSDSYVVAIVAELGNEDIIEPTLEVARVAKEEGALTLSFTVKPFSFEGIEKVERAKLDIDRLVTAVDTAVVIPSDRLLPQSDGEIDRETVLELANNLIKKAIHSIVDDITSPVLRGMDFADFRTVFSNAGLAYFGMGEGEGEFIDKEVALKAILSPTIEPPIERARSLHLMIYGGSDMTLLQVNTAAETIYELVCCNANIVFFADVNENMNSKMRVSLIATNFID